MRRDRRSRLAAALVLATGLAVVGPSFAWPADTGFTVAAASLKPAIGDCPEQAEGAVDMLPDLRMANLYGLVVRTTAAGRKRLRFGTISWNLGDGALEVRGDGRTKNVMGRVAQRIYDDQGGCRDIVNPDATMFYAGDGHNHWHVDQYMETQLYRKSGGPVLRVRKVGFCLLDLHRRQVALPNQPDSRVYWNGACGSSTSQTIAMGISVGYADDYQPMIAQQWIDVTGLPKDVYRLCSAVNANGWWLERNDNKANNYFYYDLKLNAAKNAFTIVAKGRSPCLKSK